MESREFTLIKKGRVWIECLLNNKYKCKLKINDFTKDLDLATHTLLVEDISIRSNYGTELRFEAKKEAMEEKSYIFLKHPRYNQIFYNKCKNLGGKWDYEAKAWAFLSVVQEEVEEIEYLFDGEMINLKLTAKDFISETTDSITFMGYTLAKATSRNSGAELGEEVYLLEGSIGSGGSIANWKTQCSAGAIFKISVPKNLFEARKEKEIHDFTVEII